MKFIKIVGLVLFFHASLLGVLFFQSGCQTIENGCVFDEVQCGVTEEYVQVYADDYRVASDDFYPVEDARVFSDGAGVNVVCENVPSKNMRCKPTRPIQDSFEEKSVSAKTEILKSGPTIEMQGVDYFVKPGDSLWTVAKRNGVSVADLANANGIGRDSVLKVGQKLVIPAKKGSAGVVAVSTEGATYTIAKGDTLSGIAARFHVSVEAIKLANNMKDNVIYAGRKIVIPGASSKNIDAVTVNKKSSPEKSLNLDDSYQVKNGDTLSVIAGRFGVTVNDLMKWNNILDATKLRAGQTLVVRGASMKMTPAPTATVTISDAINELDSFIPEVDVEQLEEYNNFELFEDDMLFDTSEKIPAITITEESVEVYEK